MWHPQHVYLVWWYIVDWGWNTIQSTFFTLFLFTKEFTHSDIFKWEGSHQQKTKIYLFVVRTMKNQVIHIFFAGNNKLLNLSDNNRTEEKNFLMWIRLRSLLHLKLDIKMYKINKDKIVLHFKKYIQNRASMKNFLRQPRVEQKPTKNCYFN